MPHKVEIIHIQDLTYNVRLIRVKKPENIQYVAGQAVEISLDHSNWENLKNIFSITSVPEDDFLEFVIKFMPTQSEVLDQLFSLKIGQYLIIHEPFGGIPYRGAGTFIAGGVGITPFIAILKKLENQHEIGQNKLIFANRTQKDIFFEEKFNTLLGENFINVLSDEKVEDYEHGFISQDLIEKHRDENLKYYYLCGPLPMINAVENHLLSIGVESKYIIKESF